MKTKIRVPKRWWVAIHLGLLMLIAWIVAGIADGAIVDELMAIKPREVVGQNRRAGGAHAARMIDYIHIVRRNIFNSAQSKDFADELVRAVPQGAQIGISANDVATTTLDLKLVGTVFSKEGVAYFAAIENKEDGEQNLYRLNETVADATIVKIERNRVLLKRGEKIEALEIDFSLSSKSLPPGARRGGPAGYRGAVVSRVGKGEYVVSRKYVDAQLKNMNRLLTQVRAVPNLDKNGTTNGFKLFSIKKGSVFDKLGLKNRDLVKRINGVALTSVENGLELFQALRNETSFEVDVLRGSKKTTLKFNLQ